jgi:mersacidin/lichenicidin family type 2 lantibiotic
MDIIRAWKDKEYRMSLTEEQRSLLPDNPAGLAGMELSDDDLKNIVGGGGGSKDDGKNKTHSLVKVCLFSSYVFGDVCIG